MFGAIAGSPEEGGNDDTALGGHPIFAAQGEGTEAMFHFSLKAKPHLVNLVGIIEFDSGEGGVCPVQRHIGIDGVPGGDGFPALVVGVDSPGQVIPLFLQTEAPFAVLNLGGGLGLEDGLTQLVAGEGDLTVGPKPEPGGRRDRGQNPDNYQHN